MTQDPQTPQYREAIAFLADRENHERTPVHNARTFQLASMRQLLARLGDPQNLLRAIHIAGTKGKGSTAAMLAAVGTASGYRVGLYTSPHLDCVEERFVVDGGIEAGHVGEPAALVRAAGDADHPAALDAGDLPGDGAGRARRA